MAPLSLQPSGLLTHLNNLMIEGCMPCLPPHTNQITKTLPMSGCWLLRPKPLSPGHCSTVRKMQGNETRECGMRLCPDGLQQLRKGNAQHILGDSRAKLSEAVHRRKAEEKVGTSVLPPYGVSTEGFCSRAATPNLPDAATH